MYRSTNKKKRSGENGGVKGPSSALTQFLKDQGISAQAIKSRWERRKQHEGKSETSEDLETPSVKSEENEVIYIDQEESESTETDQELASTPFDKRMRSMREDSDEEEYEADDFPVNKKVTTEKRVDDEARKAKILQTRRKKRKKAAFILDRRTEKVPTLQDLCISRISENIYKWQKENEEEKGVSFSQIRDVLGGISTDNLKNLAKALSKNRALNDHTLQLFLKTDLTELTFHDCSKLSSEGYRYLAIFSPHLTKLSLQMCGQLNNDSLMYIAEKLSNLTSISLDGPFLINESTWDMFFQKMKGRLKEFHISNTHRFTNQSLMSLLRNCGPELVSLGLATLDSVSQYQLLPQHLCNSEFHTLAIQNPLNEEDVKDETIIKILAKIGSSLRKFELVGCTELTDSMVVDGMAVYLENNNVLEALKLEELTSITTDGLVYLYSKLTMPSLKVCSLKRCTQIEDSALIELLSNPAKNSLEYLNLNSLNKLSKEVFSTMLCPNLRHLDVSFVRAVDDVIAEQVATANPNLRLMEVFGDNLVTGSAKLPHTLTVTGRESDTL
ncbi:hypothetical protein HG536_0C05490 [Torulaspora globosa]|uniref:DNA repair protein RAD7 n=1 Tax=Torulaspora globosa TaxID=48254 RepID=A0A7G3ZFU4_9SACH|nr:uncharacterized protein HG536_0C05490 [Torulaspora globosa]QLL32380.1 hypothetical protein HG536_0C05490 [Torulaspora globosa]